MYESMDLSSVLANVERAEIGLYAVLSQLFLFSFGILQVWYDIGVKSKCV